MMRLVSGNKVVIVGLHSSFLAADLVDVEILRNDRVVP